MSAAKLTEAQNRELSDLALRSQRAYYDDGYKPIARLLTLGYVDRREGKFGSYSSYAITPAGRAALTGETPPTPTDAGKTKT